MLLKAKKLHFIFIVIFCFGQGFTSVHFFHPPLLNIKDAYVDTQANVTLEIICIGKYPLSWKTPLTRVENRVSIRSSVDISEPINKHKSTISLEDLDYNDTGFYVCYYEGTTDLSSVDNATSIYVFVNDPVHLFVENSAVISGHLLIPLLQHRKSVIPCMPTGSNVNVTLWKTESEDDFGEMVSTGTDVTFDPRQGFHLYYPTIYFNGFFQCRAYLGDNYQEINLTLFYMPDTYNDPQPYIDASEALHPVVNGTFILKCIVDADPDTRLFIDWDYPNKENSEGRMNETKPYSHWKTTRSYKHQEVTTYLIVNNARSNDSGTYTCTATDHSQKTGQAATKIFVYAFKQPIHVNFTTDIDLSEPLIYQAGQDIKFVITVDAFPSMSDVELYWEKDGELLQPDNHYLMKIVDSTVVLEIKHLVRADAANYTLYGKTKDVLNSISIILEVKDKPIVTLRHTEILYKIGTQYTLECHADGFPAPIVWWKWKPCKETQECEPGNNYGWRDVEPNGNFPNRENISLEHSEVRSFSLVSYLHLTARQSGHYICIASNVMGKDDVIAPFIVTDADNGFEIQLSERKPIDKDFVELVCKVTNYNFSIVQWMWRPMYSAGQLRSLENISDVAISYNSSSYSHSASVNFNPINLNMSGEYECIGKSLKNNFTAKQHIIIDVKEIQKPVLNKTNMGGITILIAPGSLQEFYCYSYGVPTPKTSWKKDGKAFDASNVTGADVTENNQRLTIRRVLERDAGFYECVVENRGGVIKANATLDILTDNKHSLKNSLTTGEITALIVFGIVAVILVFVVSCLVQRILKEKKQKKELDFISHNVFERGYIDIFNPNLPLEDQIDLLPYKHNCEFPKERLKLGKTLGQGAFGRVVKAEAIGLVDGEASTTVAVKMLKEAADLEQRKALIAELKILIHIGKHLNIVNLLGAVTKNISKGELYVIVEYCCYGNLRHFLLKHKGSYLDQLDHRTGQLDPQISTLPGSPFLNMKENMVTYSNILGLGMDNPTYREQSLNYADLAHQQVTNDSGTGISVFTIPSGSSTSDRYLRNSLPTSTMDITSESWNEEIGKNHFITTCDLLCFAFQCARGMEYLASRKLIHRDLAARNVLIAKDNVVKICDFGLAKDCYKYSNYVKKTSGLLPIKWMAVESIGDRVYTSKSDTWSFGILLWEIFTLGGNPYPGIEVNEEFFKKLNNGYRMEKPELAPEIIYQLMKSCWLHDPNQRPEFSYLAERIGALLETSVRKYYVELNEPYQMMNEEITLNNNDYLQMAGGESTEEYTNMVKPSEIPLQTKNEIAANSYDGLTSEHSINSGPMAKMPGNSVPMIQLESLSQISKRETLECTSQDTDTTYLNMTNISERDENDDCDSVFYQWKGKDGAHYENGHMKVEFKEVSTRC